MIGRIYGIFDKKRDKFVYTGQTIDPEDFEPHGKHMLKLFRKYPYRYNYIIHESNIQQEQLDDRETYYTKKYKTFEDPTCFNFTPGGTGGYTLQKFSPEKIAEIRRKMAETKRANPLIMKMAAKKARETFNNRPKEFIEAVNSRRGINATKTRTINNSKKSPEELQLMHEQHSLVIKEARSKETKFERDKRNEKITKTLRDKFIPICCQNLLTKEIKTLNSTQWLKQFKVHIWHLKAGLQHKSNNWAIV